MNQSKFSLKENITEIIAIIIVVMSFAFLSVVAFKTIPPENKELINITVGFVLGTAMSGVVGYYFGTSKIRSNKPEDKK